MHRLLLALGFVASCSAAPEPTSQPSPGSSNPSAQPSRSTAGQLYGVMQTLEGLTLQIDSGGCRQNSDVTFAVVADALTISNIAFDSCDAFIELGDQLHFAWAELPKFDKLALVTDPVPVLQPGSKLGPTRAPAGASDDGILGALVTRDGLDVRVWSGGCTSADHFSSWIEPGDTQIVHLIRTQIDRCEAEIPEGVLLHFTWEQLGVTGAAARLANPIVALPAGYRVNQ